MSKEQTNKDISIRATEAAKRLMSVGNSSYASSRLTSTRTNAGVVFIHSEVKKEPSSNQ